MYFGALSYCDKRMVMLSYIFQNFRDENGLAVAQILAVNLRRGPGTKESFLLFRTSTQTGEDTQNCFHSVAMMADQIMGSDTCTVLQKYVARKYMYTPKYGRLFVTHKLQVWWK
jgi:hypothetical protein